MNIDIPAVKEFAFMEFEDGVILYGKAFPKGKFCKYDSSLLNAILDIDMSPIPVLKDSK